MDGKKSSFWPSYVDIMTTLFAIMLVLFAVSYSRFKIKEKELLKYKDQMEEINSIYQAVDNIDKKYFEFNEEYLKHIFKIQVNYRTKEFSPYKLKQDEKGDIAGLSGTRGTDGQVRASLCHASHSPGGADDHRGRLCGSHAS